MDLYPEGTKDEVHFERAAMDNRVLVTNDRRIEAIANRWLAEGRAFRGLILWPQRHYTRMTTGDLLQQIAALAEPFPHRVIHLKPAQSCRLYGEARVVRPCLAAPTRSTPLPTAARSREGDLRMAIGIE
jgi:hypothetical protein